MLKGTKKTSPEDEMERCLLGRNQGREDDGKAAIKGAADRFI